jgi:hypothetical protein
LNTPDLIHEELGESSEESFAWPEIKQSDGRKMKTVFWDKISQNKIMSSIWMYIYKHNPTVHFDRILDLYEDKIHRKKGKSKYIKEISFPNL